MWVFHLWLPAEKQEAGALLAITPGLQEGGVYGSRFSKTWLSQMDVIVLPASARTDEAISPYPWWWKW